MYGIIGLPSDWLGLIRFRDRRDLRSPGVAEGPQRSPRMVALSSVRTMVATVDTAVGCRPTHRAKSNATRTRSPGRSTASFCRDNPALQNAPTERRIECGGDEDRGRMGGTPDQERERKGQQAAVEHGALWLRVGGDGP